MKTKLFLALRTVFLLAACAPLDFTPHQGDSSGEGQGTTSQSGTSTSEESEGWTAAEEKLMKDNLGGNVIPYYYVEDMEVTDDYFEEYGCISVEAPAASMNDLNAYRTILTNKGYTCDYDIGDDEEYEESMGFYIECEDSYEFYVEAYLGSNNEWYIDAYYYEGTGALVDHSVENIATYANLVSETQAYFAAFEETCPVLPGDISTSATMYHLYDVSYIYGSLLGSALDYAYAGWIFEGAVEADLATIIAAFVNVGYEEATDEYGTYYANSDSYIEGEFVSDDGGYVTIYILNF